MGEVGKTPGAFSTTPMDGGGRKMSGLASRREKGIRKASRCDFHAKGEWISVGFRNKKSGSRPLFS
jgi:hypothetical protein